MIRASLKILVRTLLSVFVLIGLTGLILVAALSRGPVSLSFAAPYLSQVLASQYPEITLDFDELNLLWDGRDKTFVFGVTNVSVIQETETIAVIPDVTVTFSSAALMEGRVAPSGLEFTGLKVLLTRTADGAVSLGYSYNGNDPQELEGPTENQTSAAFIHDLIAGLEKGRRQSDLAAYLERIEVYGSSLFVEDEKQDKIWRVTSADMVIWRTDTGLVGRIQGDTRIGEESITLIANAAYNARNRTTVINTKVADFPIALIASEVAELERLKGVTLTISGDINVSLDQEFLPVQVGFNLQSSAGQVDLPDLYKKPLEIKSVAVQGHSTAPFTALNINTLEIDTIIPKIRLSGTFSNTEKGFGTSIEGSILDFETNDLALYWPYSVVPDGYNWVTKNIREGKAKDATFRVDLPPGALQSGKIPDNAVEVKFGFDGISVDYFSPLPKVENISGNGILTEKQVHVFDLTGQIDDVMLPEGDVMIYDFDQVDQITDVTLKVKGQNKPIFEFLDLKPLELVGTYGINPAAMKGDGEIEAQFVFPLRHDLTLEKVIFEARGDFKNTFIPRVYDELHLSEGNLTATVTPDMLSVAGPAKIEGVNAQVIFHSWFKGPKAGTRRYEATAKLQDADRTAMKVDTEYLTGPVSATLGFDLMADGTASGMVTLNLLEAAIDIPDLLLSKPIGAAGLFGAQLKSDGKGNTEISNIRLSSDALNVIGQAKTDAEGLVSFSASKISYGDNDVTLNIQRKQPDNYVADLRGRVFDLRPFIVGNYSLNRGRAEPTKNPLSVRLNIALDRIIMDGGISLKNAAGHVNAIEGVSKSGQINARFTDAFGIHYTLQPSEKGRKFEFRSDHAGLLLQGLDINDTVREGTLVITGEVDDTKQESLATGWVDMKDIRVVKAPVLGKILTIGSLGGIVDLLRNEGMTFATVEGPFTYQDGVITTKDFRAVGSIGITVTGKIDKQKNTLSAFGTVIPSYTLNSILGNIPILGRLLVGRKGEGIFGFSYKVHGSTAEPVVSVNPVSALAPGILRRMFFEPWDGESAGDKPAEADVQSKTDKP